MPWYLYQYPFWGVSDFPVTYHGYYSFLSFLSGFLFCWCEENTGRHFKGFYFIKKKKKIEACKTITQGG